jgi:hypothetical protein
MFGDDFRNNPGWNFIFRFARNPIDQDTVGVRRGIHPDKPGPNVIRLAAAAGFGPMEIP